MDGNLRARSGFNLSGANLSGAKVNQSLLADAIVTGADMELTNLTSANLSGANVNDANFTNANLTGAFRRPGISRTKLDGAKGLDTVKCLVNWVNEILTTPVRRSNQVRSKMKGNDTSGDSQAWATTPLIQRPHGSRRN
ncbi:MAG: pentapeptide repeat-containing protein [Chloroflexi bacterium]|nr:pentapeptide repeat-containing protein [Chloroflexota bacterium]